MKVGMFLVDVIGGETTWVGELYWDLVLLTEFMGARAEGFIMCVEVSPQVCSKE